MLPRVSNRKLQKLFPFVQMAWRCTCVPKSLVINVLAQLSYGLPVAGSKEAILLEMNIMIFLFRTGS